MSILVTGGAGYIGCHVVKELLAQGKAVVVLDDLSKGHRESVPASVLVKGSCGDRAVVRRLVRERGVDAVMHLAANSLVGESMVDPAKYGRSNVVDAVALLEVCREEGVRRFVFSSTAAVYGEPVAVPIAEDHPLVPVNVYGATKLMFEQMLEWYDRAYGMRYVSLRYFNAAGADESGEIGEDHDPETHLIPIVLQAALGKREKVTVFGDDYPTPDGTCVRDYIHVIDLAQA
ncbi:MAG: UDP-glucose 4-epimerase GalE, partial [Candidatus Desulforudis sp.]|nr:UDP-glucose 4-epimerase GalE [Desulforudis sp.]